MSGRSLFAVLALVLSVWLSGCGPTVVTQPAGSIPRGKFDPPRLLPNFTLVDQNAMPLSLTDLRGRVVWLYFGYTHCPDVCPLTLNKMSAVKSSLGPDSLRPAFVFISVDGSRDTPEVVRKFIRTFDADFIGLTGDEAHVRQVARDYTAEFDVPTPDTTAAHEANYQVNHTSYSYLLDRQGRLSFLYLPETPNAVIVSDLLDLLSR